MEKVDEYAKFRIWGRIGGLKNRQQSKAGKARSRKLSKARQREIAKMGGVAKHAALAQAGKGEV